MMIYFFRLVLVAAVFVSTSACMAQEETGRTWTSANGKHTFEAELQSVAEGVAMLRGADGKVKKVPLSSLSADDQTYIANFAKNASATKPAKLSSEQRDRLKELGLKFSRGEFALIDEKDLKARINRLLKKKKNIVKMAIQLGMMKQQVLQAKDEIISLTQANGQLNTRLSNVSSVKENNQLVGMLNANNDKMKLIDSQIQKGEEQIKQGQVEVNSAREQFVQEVLDVRKYSDSFDENMQTLDADERFEVVKNDIETKMSIETKPLGETKSLARLRKSLAKLESGVLTDTIPLRDDGSGTFNATVTINGKPPIELIVDSGASLICLPQKVADDLGVVVGSDAREIIMTIADGSKIPGKLITLESVRLGKFTAKNVDCVVLGRKAKNAPSLLGMSFLGQFKFELDAAKGELKMVSVETE